MEEPKKTKSAKIIHHLSRTGSSEVIVDITFHVETEGEGPSKYQVSQVRIGKQTKWGELDTLEFATSTVMSKMEKTIRVCSTNWEVRIRDFMKKCKNLNKMLALGEEVIKNEDLLGGDDFGSLQSCIFIIEFKI